MRGQNIGLHRNSEWIIKSPITGQKILASRNIDILCAPECGIQMQETKLFPSDICSDIWDTEFDRKIYSNGDVKRVHMLCKRYIKTHRIPNLDYNILMKLTLELTKDFSEVKKCIGLCVLMSLLTTGMTIQKHIFV